MQALRVLVTGSTGNLGRAVRARFEKSARWETTFLSGPRHGGPDLSDPEQIRRVVAESAPDAVVHLAGLLGGACEADPERTKAINIDAARNLASAAKDAGARRFVFASTAAVYGDDLSSPVNEVAPLQGSSAYATSKIAAERALAELCSADFDLVALRIFNVYGDGFAGSLVERLRSATADLPVTLNGLDEFVRDYVHADDVAAAIEASLSGPEGTHTFNIGSGEPVSSRELVRRLQRQGKVHYTVAPGRPSYSCADISTARRELGFTPRGVS